MTIKEVDIRGDIVKDGYEFSEYSVEKSKKAAKLLVAKKPLECLIKLQCLSESFQI